MTPDPIGDAIRAGRLLRVSPVLADPGNPGQVIALFTNGAGVHLIGVNATPDTDGIRRLICVPVPGHFTDPLTAAAWSYDDEMHPVRCSPSVYALLSRRT